MSFPDCRLPPADCRWWPAPLLAGLILLSACTTSNKTTPTTAPTAETNTPLPNAATVTSTAARASRTATATSPSSPFGTPRIGTGTPGAFPGFPTGSATPATPSAAASADLQRIALQGTDLPSGFTLTDSGPGGPELGRDVVASFQQEYQQRDVTSTQSLQQTIVIVDLLGQYKDATSAGSAVKGVNLQSLNQLLGSASLTAEPATVASIGEDTGGYHFTGSTNGVSVGGYLIVFHRGSTAALVVTAAVKGSESLPQTVSLAQRQDQKLQSGG
ncbi:MAG: hypothetical protein ACR2PL_18515 [Dehalococcoidia bacterium]